MKKDIYIIKNTVNDKAYIGQSINPWHRWQQHISEARSKLQNKGANNNPLYNDMASLGIDKFYYEVLETQVDDPDKREAYWIKKYNTRVPHGYNVSPGGVMAGFDAAAPIFKNNEELMKCIEEISSSKKSFTNIARKFNCCEEVISAINLGKRYAIDGMVYPLRRKIYGDDMAKQIRYSIKYEQDLTLGDIAKKYGIDISQVSLINQGKAYYVSSEDYPLRKKRVKDLDFEKVSSVIDDIIQSDMCMSEIAKKHNISRNIVSRINTGNSYKNDAMIYPLREENDPRNNVRKKFFDSDEIDMIIDLLRTDMSIKEIAKRFNTTNATINNINNGKIKKYHDNNIKYPIRNFRDHQPVSTICV